MPDKGSTPDTYPPTNGATATATSTRTNTRTIAPPEDDTGSTVKLSTTTHTLLRDLRKRSGGKLTDAVILRALLLLDKELPQQVQSDYEWATA